MRPRPNEAGIALVVVLLMLMLVAALMAGFAAVLMSEQNLQRVDEDRTESFYAAHGGLEKLTSDLGTLFNATYAPTGTQVTALNSLAPTLPGVTFATTTDGPGYGISFTPDANGNPVAVARSITSGTYQGFTGLVTSYVVAVTARTGNVGETRLQREIQSVAIPLFQFGQFSETDIGFHPAYDFDFGGRIHTNGNLFLAAGDTLTISAKVTALGEVIRTHVMNGMPTAGNWSGDVRLLTAPGAYRALETDEGSLLTTIGSAQNPTWNDTSLTTYHGYITNGRTGARRLDLPVVQTGNTPIDLIRRPLVGESTATGIYLQRYFSMASLRILLSDTTADITGLPSVTATAPIPLDITTPGGYTVNASHPPFARSPTSGVPNSTYLISPNQPLLGGYIKIEKQTTAGVWQDVTLEILNLGIAGRNQARSGCTEQSPDAVIRIQRLKDDTSTCAPSAANQILGSSYWPMVLYDTREALRRENEPTGNTDVYLGGVMHYIELDVRNLTRWFQGTIGTTGTAVYASTGYTVYFSDRRGNRNAAGQETGEYGAEDFVNPASSSGAANGSLDAGEDVNSNGTLDVYGQTPQPVAGVTFQAGSDLDGNARPWTTISNVAARANPARFFRRALKLTNGALGNIVSPGLTIAAENPVYVQGNYNANNSGFGNPHVACSISADAVTLLSNSWSDYNGLQNPHNAANRDASNTWYRVAIMAGKGRAFPRPSAGTPPTNFGTDGGTHNFMRMLESWTNSHTLFYRGSMASLYYNRQATGVFKDGNNTYDPPDRDYLFDVDFLTPTLLPPRTPMFRDINTLGFFPVNVAPGKRTDPVT